MLSKNIYEYAIIRYVPKVELGEFINVGVILLSKRLQFLDMKFKLDTDRLQAFCDQCDEKMILEYLNSWKLMCKGNPEGGEIGAMETHVRFRWLTANRSTIIQSSAVHSGICQDPQQTLERLYEKYVR